MKIQSMVIILLLFMQVVTPVMAAPPTHANIMGDIALYGKIQAEGNTGTMDIKLNNGKIHIKDSVHGKKKVKMYLPALEYVDGFDGDRFSITHKNDAGIIDGSKIITLTTQDKARGFIIMDMTFSENIIGGFTGTYNYISDTINGNATLNLPNTFNVSYINFSITNGFAVNGEVYVNRTLITINGSNAETLSNVPLMIKLNLPGVSDTGSDVRLAHMNGTPIAREIEWKWANDDVSLYYPFNTISGADSQFYVYWGNSALTEPASDSMYGSQAVWDSNYVGVWHMNDYPHNGTMDDSTGHGYNLTSVGAMTSGDLIDSEYGKGIDFDGINDGLYHSDDAGLDGFPTMNLLVGFSTSASTINRALVSKWYTGTSAYILRADEFSIGNIDMSVYTGSSISIVSSASYNDGAEHIAILNYDGTNFYNIVDDVPASIGKTGAISNAEEEFAVGMTKNGATEASFFTGVITEVRLHNSSRSVEWDGVMYTNLNNPTATGGDAFYKTFGSIESGDSGASIGASVTGDSNSSIYGIETINFTLVPSEAISQILLESNSTTWSYVVTLYWTEDTLQIAESASSGIYAQQIDLTPSENVDTGWVNGSVATFNISAQEYGSSQLAYLDGGNVTSDLVFIDNTSFNLSVVNLIANQTHNITFQYLYNNAPTVGTITNQSCTKGLACTISTPTYSDPEGLGHTDFWDYGDGHNGTDGIHAYESSGTYNLTLNITEVATISPQTIIRNATITVTGFNLTITVRDTDSTVLINNYTATHESTNIVTTNGTATFTDLAYGPTSVLVASTGYYASAGSIELTQNDSLIVYLSNEGGDYYAPHYVKFRLRSILWHKYTNIDTVVYYAGTAIHTGETDNDGSIGFMLSEDKQYRVTFINATQGISEEVTIYPVDVQYTVIIGLTGIIPDDRPDDDILYGTAKSSINLTTGYVNATFNDTSGTTTLAEFWVNNTNGTNVYYTNTTNSTETFSALVPGGNTTYMTRFKITNTVMSDPLEVVRSLKFNDVVRYSLGLDEGWKYQFIAIVLIFFVGLLGSALNADKMAVIVVLAGWFFMFLGWLTAGASVGGEIGAGMMLMLATLLAFGNAVRKGDVG